MSKVAEVLNRWWTRLLIGRYRKEQARAARTDREAEERIQNLQAGGQPYGSPASGQF